MGKPKKGSKLVVVSQSTDLDTFNAQEQLKQNSKKANQSTSAQATS